MIACHNHLEMSSLVVLLGRTSKPACGIDDYCNFLGKAFARQDIALERVQVDWAERGWVQALLDLWRKSAAWNGKWVLLQYTAGAWSRLGFPFAALAVLAILHKRGALCAITYHEPWRWEVTNSRTIDRLRGACQDWVIQRLFRSAQKAVFPDPLNAINWLPKGNQKSAFIPIGANVPESADVRSTTDKNEVPKTVAVFCLSKLPNLHHELDEISYALRFASAGGMRLRVIFVGRGTAEAQDHIERAFNGGPIEVVNLGIRSSEEVSLTLAKADAMLCVRGRLFPRRGSALAGIACGVPIIAYEGPAQQTPIAEAGVEFVPYRDREALGSALLKILTNRKLQDEFRQKNRRCQEMYFSWNRIAARHIEALGFIPNQPQYGKEILSTSKVAEASICAS
jgi:glycosyltransferase involved in cell wall biosynthesis